MTSMCFIFSLLVASTLAITGDDLLFKANLEDAMARAGITPRMLESNIIDKVDAALNSLPEFIPWLNLTYSNSNNTNLVSTGYMENVTVVGMKNHTIDLVKFSVLPLHFNMHIFLNDVLVSGLYDLDALLLGICPIYGNDHIDAGAAGVDVYVSVDLQSIGGYLSVSKLEFTFKVKAVTFKFNNLLGGDMGIVIGQLVEGMFPEYVDRVMYYYGDDLRGLIVSKVNIFLEDKTANDLIDWIKQTTTEKPTTVSLDQLSP